MVMPCVKRKGISAVEFRVRLREVRMERRKTQRETAELLGMNLRSYQLYEQGKVEPSLKKLVALADFLDVTTDYLLGRTDRE